MLASTWFAIAFLAVLIALAFRSNAVANTGQLRLAWLWFLAALAVDIGFTIIRLIAIGMEFDARSLVQLETWSNGIVSAVMLDGVFNLYRAVSPTGRFDSPRRSDERDNRADDSIGSG